MTCFDTRLENYVAHQRRKMKRPRAQQRLQRIQDAGRCKPSVELVDSSSASCSESSPVPAPKMKRLKTPAKGTARLKLKLGTPPPSKKKSKSPSSRKKTKKPVVVESDIDVASDASATGGGSAASESEAGRGRSKAGAAMAPPKRFKPFSPVQLVDGGGTVMAYGVILDDEPKIPDDVVDEDGDTYMTGCFKRIQVGQIKTNWGTWSIDPSLCMRHDWSDFANKSQTRLDKLSKIGSRGMSVFAFIFFWYLRCCA